jgi:N-acetyl-anhydromuramyl-L-alanine amidase AmpD
MRTISLIVIHCSASRCDRPLDPEAIRLMHKARGYADWGYHYYVRQDGTVCPMRPLERVGAHVRGHNLESIGVCYEGGLDKEGKPADTRTDAQKKALATLVSELLLRFPTARVVGHRDLSPDLDGDGTIEPHEWLKQCPCFNV